jgi:hypothetical protein
VVFAGTKVPIKQLIDHLDRGNSIDEFLRRFPQLPADLVSQACALGLEALVRAAPEDPVPAQASLLPRFDAKGVVVNGEELGAAQVVGRQVRCPACRDLVFKSWPEGWDGHAARRCRGLRPGDYSARKAEFKRRFEHLFRSR